MALAKVCTAALLFGRAAAAHAGAGAGAEAADLRLDVAPGGRSFRVSLDGAAWLESAPTFLRAGNASHDSSTSLELVEFSGPTAG